MKPKNLNKAGSSFVETLVALFIFALFVGGACKVMMAHRKVIDKSRNHYLATNIAKNQIEQVRNTLQTSDFDQIYNREESGVFVDANGDPDELRASVYRRKTEIVEIEPNLAEIIVTVEILDRVKMEFDGEEVQLSSFIARPYG